MAAYDHCILESQLTTHLVILYTSLYIVIYKKCISEMNYVKNVDLIIKILTFYVHRLVDMGTSSI